MKIKITSEYITLGQFLKHVNLIGTGGEAKYFIQENTIFVNDDLEDRRGRKLYPSDRISIVNHGDFKIVL